MKNKQFRFGEIRTIPKDVEETRTIWFLASDETVDRHKSILTADGWELDNYRKNPIVGYMHNIYSTFRPDPDNVIGTAEIKQEDGKLLAGITYEPEEINPLAEKLFKKTKHGTLRTVSVGFFPVKSHDGDPEKGELQGIKYFTEKELLEISLTNLPSNPNALAQKRASEEEKIELIQYILNEALGDKFNEKLTIKGIMSILRGEEQEPDGKVKFPNRLKILELINQIIKKL